MSTPLHGASVRLRPYASQDERSWLRCRALSFLDSQYYDDVRPAHPAPSPEQGETISWVAADALASDVVGILEVEVGQEGTDLSLIHI